MMLVFVLRQWVEEGYEVMGPLDLQNSYIAGAQTSTRVSQGLALQLCTVWLRSRLYRLVCDFGLLTRHCFTTLPEDKS